MDDSYIHRSPDTYDSSGYDDGYRHGQGTYGSPSDVIGKRDERSRSEDGSLGDSVSKPDEGTCLVFLAVLLVSWWGRLPGAWCLKGFYESYG